MPDPQDPAQTPAQNEPAAAPAAPAAPPADDNNQPAPAAGDEGQQAAEPQQPAGAQTPANDPNGQQPAAGGSRAERRIKQLNEKVRQATQPNQPFGGQQQSPQFPQYQDGQQVSSQQLQQDVVQTADAIATIRVNQQLAQRDAVNNFDRDTETIPTKFKELNKDDPSYTEELDEAIAQEFQERAFKVVGYDQQNRPITQLDPSVRLSDIAERHVRGARAYAAKSNGNIQTAVDSSADTTSPRPTGAKPSERPFESLSLAEMKAKVGYHRV